MDKKRELRALFWGGIVAALIIATATVAAALLGGVEIHVNGVGPKAPQESDPSPPSAQPESRLPTEPEEDPPDVPAEIETSIVDLAENGKAQSLSAFDGDYGVQRIGGISYTDGVSMLVFPDRSGIHKLAVRTEGRYTQVSGVVGIDGAASCVSSPAQVSIEDDLGRTLWGPVTVGARSHRPFSADLGGAIRVYLTQISLVGEDACGNGSVNPAWGEVVFRTDA